MRDAWSWIRRVCLIAPLIAGFSLLSCSAATRAGLEKLLFETSPTTQPESDEDATSPLLAGPSVAGGSAFRSVHPPFLQGHCHSCHNLRMGQTLMQPWNLRCLTCHPGVMSAAFVHGPVAAFACNECHLPHASSLDHLLRRPEPDQCLFCHASTLKTDRPWHADVKRACTLCHDPHTGANAAILKPTYTWRDLAPEYFESDSRPVTTRADE